MTYLRAGRPSDGRALDGASDGPSDSGLPDGGEPPPAAGASLPTAGEVPTAEGPTAGESCPSGAGTPGGTAGAAPGSYGVSVLFRERHAELVRLAVLLVGDRPSAEDIVQDVFARLCLRDRLPGGDGSLAYVRAAVLNGCRSALRRRAVARRFGNSSDPLARGALQESAEHEAILAEDRRQVLTALAALPPRRREVLVLRYWLGLTEAEIAAVLGISTGTVKSTAARGLAALASKLGEQS
jgi:RNA polymerase sigma-70 factor (sigma-E family)